MSNLDLLKQQHAALGKTIEGMEAKPVKLDFAAMRKEKESKVDKFANALKAAKMGKVHEILTAAGYARGFNNAEKATASYGIKSKPGLLVSINGNFFAIKKHNEVVHSGDIEFLADWINRNK